MPAEFLIGRNLEEKMDSVFSLAMANRHGLIAGATGTGKTVTLQAFAEHFSEAGVPVFVADIKGDLSGLAALGGDNGKIVSVFGKLDLKLPAWRSMPCALWDVFGKKGHPVRATVSDMGPLLMGRLLGLSDVQHAVLQVLFRFADDKGLLLLDTKDLRALVEYAGVNARELQARYGLMTGTSLSAVQRALLVLEDQGGSRFFGEPALDIQDLMRCDTDGRGMINVLASDELVNQPVLYASFLLWMLSELFEELPETGDAEKPRLVFFFDEAHLLFADAPEALMDKIVQVVRLVRSKGVGVWFVTQNPLDIPEEVLGQLGNRVQHALRAFTPKDQKAVKVVAQTFRPNPKIDTETAITELGIGEALVSFLDMEGRPSPVERVRIIPPASRIGVLTAEERSGVLEKSGLGTKYDKALDRESAYELLGKKADQAAALAELMEMERQSSPEMRLSSTDPDIGMPEGPESEPERKPRKAARVSGEDGSSGSLLGDIAGGVMKSAGRELGRQLVRGLLGGLAGSSRRRR